MKKIVLFAMGLVLSGTTLAQDDKKSEFETTIKGDFVNEYIWRGLKLGDVAVQPTFGVGYKGLSLTAWGNYGLSNKDDVKEFDLTLAYSIGGFNFGVTDYWFSEGLDPDKPLLQVRRPWHQPPLRSQHRLRLRSPGLAVVHQFRRQRRPEQERQAGLQQLF